MIVIYILFAVCCVAFLFIKRDRIMRYFDAEIEEIKDLNYTNDEIKFHMIKYEKFNSSELLTILKDGMLTESEMRAIRKILNDRKGMFPNVSDFS